MQSKEEDISPKPNPAPFKSGAEEGVVANNFTGTVICSCLIRAALLHYGMYGTWPQPSAQGRIQGSSNQTWNLFRAGSLNSANQSWWFLSGRAGIFHHEHSKGVCVWLSVQEVKA